MGKHRKRDAQKKAAERAVTMQNNTEFEESAAAEEYVPPAPASKILPCEASGEIPAKYEQFKSSSTEAERSGLLLEILNSHPFVKKGGVEVTECPEHRFESRRFQLDVRGFQKWIRTEEGRGFKDIAGGVSDDALYTLSPMLRELLPRGLHSILALPKEDLRMTQLWFRGIPKFTGLEANDEDEASNSHQANFFYGGARCSITAA